jgi:hypothetical protein
MNFCFKDGFDKSGPAQDFVNDDMLDEFKTQLVTLINEILNTDIPFTEKIQ